MMSAVLRVATLSAIVSMPAIAQDPAPVSLDSVVTIGTRATDRTSTKSAVPVDVVTSDAIQSTGLVDTWQILQRLVPSINVPHIPRGDDGTRPITLRGLSPAQVLVLVNGKRPHAPAVIAGGPVLNGAVINDIGWIPVSSIERIEILRDGAAAQYGSDAIAGVVNIVLKSSTSSDGDVVVGQTYTSEGGRTFHDGLSVNVSGAQGIRIGRAGNLTLSGELRDRESTNRAYPDERRQYFAGDPRNNNPPIVRNEEGDAESRAGGGFLNFFFPLRTHAQLYAFGGGMVRTANSSGLFRRATDSRNVVRTIHPDGFLPYTEREVHDYSGTAGARGTFRRWKWDLSSTVGGNAVRYDVSNSNNASLGVASPTDFYAGKLSAHQWTTDVGATRSFGTTRAGSFNLAAGAGFRWEHYRIDAGDSASYIDGGVRILDGDSAGAPAAVGAQGMPGFRPEDEISVSRTNLAAYVDLENRVNRRLLLDIAARAETYSNSSSTVDGKVAGRVELVRGLALRGAAGTGFRAPSLIQSYFTSSRGIFIVQGGRVNSYQIRQLPVNSEPAKLLGAKSLVPERSTNVSAGVVFDKARMPTVTADYYRIDVRDRIVRSSEFRDPSVRVLLESHGILGVAGAQYFANAVDTRTRGVDVVANYGIVLGSSALLRIVAGYNQTRTEVTHVDSVPPALSRFQATLFGRTQEGSIEAGQPQRTLSVTMDYSHRRFGLNLRNQRFGEASLLDSDLPAADQTVEAKWVTDLALSWRLSARTTIMGTAANLFDVYPTEWIDFKLGAAATGGSVAGNFRYPGGISPFGMNGRTVYLKLSYR